MSPLCPRCHARATEDGGFLCAICALAPPCTWRLIDARTWLPRALAIAVLCTSITVLTLGAIVRSAVGGGSFDALRLAVPSSFCALGAPVSVSISTAFRATHGWTPYATLDGSFRLSSFALIVLAGVSLTIVGAYMARACRAANEVEHAVAGMLASLPIAMLSGIAASLMRYSATATAIQGIFRYDVLLYVAPLHAFSATLLWATLWGVTGALLRYAWTTRTMQQQFRAFERPWRACTCGAAAALFFGYTLATLGSFIQCAETRQVSSRAAVDQITRVLAVEERLALDAALLTQPFAFDCGVPLEGHVVALPGTGLVPPDSSLRVQLGQDVTADDPLGHTRARLPLTRWWMLVPILSALLGGALTAALHPTRIIWRSVQTGLLFALGATALAAWQGAWCNGLVHMAVGHPYLPLWAVWQPPLWTVAWKCAAIGVCGSCVGAYLKWSCC